MRRNIRDVYLYNTIGRIFLEELINHPQFIITSLSFLYKNLNITFQDETSWMNIYLLRLLLK